MILLIKILGGLNSVLQTVLLTLKLTGYISWPWLNVMAPTLIPVFLVGVATLWFVFQIFNHRK